MDVLLSGLGVLIQVNCMEKWYYGIRILYNSKVIMKDKVG